MEDYLSEKEQWEWVKGQVREHAPSVIVAVAVVSAAFFGWRQWQEHLDKGRLQAGDRYTQMVQALERGDRSQALVMLGELERESPASAYTDQARLLAARVYVDSGDFEHAASSLSAVAEQSKDHELAMIARLRLARVQIAQGKAEAALATLGPQSEGAFGARYHEVRGDALYAKGDRAAALTEYRSAQGAGNGAATPLLDLKIADLAASAPPTGAKAAAPAAVAPASAPIAPAATPAAGK
ncbi:MAG TPA: tetratricopeptide repeat protein [Steroidobacteraceae bacterium]|nr:tetratricopeptide repeat protein [Steroidobacteraceae bacterium]